MMPRLIVLPSFVHLPSDRPRLDFMTRIFFIVALCLTANRLFAEENPETTVPVAPSMFEQLTVSCKDCHEEESGFNVHHLKDEQASFYEKHELWEKVRQRLADHSMPPADGEPLDHDVRLKLVDWIGSSMHNAFVEKGEKAGPPMFRRMAKHEFSNTIRDLMGVHMDAGHALPEDAAGGEGFNNAAETLTISPVHIEKYVEAATMAVEYAAQDETSRKKLFQVSANEKISEVEAARKNIQRLADQAFRRPATKEEVDELFRLYEDARKDGLDDHQACFYAMRAILVSVNFLFIAEEIPETRGVEVPLTDHEIAARLSYFLWATTPDRELREAADKGKLHDPEELKKQTLRLLSARGTRLEDSMSFFVGQWLGTQDWGRSKTPDSQLHPWIQDHHVAAMRSQPVIIFEKVLKDNRSLLELVDSNWTVLNAELFGVYKLNAGKLNAQDVNQFLKPVELPDEFRNRASLLGCGAIMGITSYPKRTSPVLRGAWVMDKVFGIELPPPPPNVPPLEATANDALKMTVRQQLEKHRENAACATCHDRIDPIGFSLENFDVLGRWRDKDDGGPIDPKAVLADGQDIDGLAGLKQYILENKSQFLRHLTKKMLGYSLARGLRPSDISSVETIVGRLEENDYKAQELILGIVMSKPFLYKKVVEE